MPKLNSICVFCGSSRGENPAFADAAHDLGTLLARIGRQLVYGGGNVGLMGIVADAALAAGGKAIGVIPEALVAREVAHNGLTKLHVVGSMHERKALMADLSDGFIALPGGIGTLEELFEVWTWGQLGLHRKPYGLLNIAGFHDPLLTFLDQLVATRFIRQEHRDLLLVAPHGDELIALMEAQQPPELTKWIDQPET